MFNNWSTDERRGGDIIRVSSYVFIGTLSTGETQRRM